MNGPAFRWILDVCPQAALGLMFVGCLPQNSDSADAGTNGSGTPATGMCVSQPNPCGGDVSGTWSVQSICALTNPADAVNARFSSYPDCAGACMAASMTASGTKDYSSGLLTSKESFRLMETLSFTSACFSEVMGTSLAEDTCQAAALQFSSAKCNLSFVGCTCQIDQAIPNDTFSYQVSGNTLTEVDGLQGTNIDYCVIGNTMTQRRTLAPGANYIVTYARR